MTKITIERETLLPCPFCGDDGDKGRQEVTQMIEGRNKFARITCRACGAMCPEENWNRRAALAAQPAEPAYTHADVAEAHAKGYALGLRQVDRPHPTDAQPTGQSPCARHCEAPAFEGEIRRLKRELQTQAERVRVLREALERLDGQCHGEREVSAVFVRKVCRAALEATGD